MLTHLNLNNIIQFIILVTIGGTIGNLLSIYVDSRHDNGRELKKEITISKIALSTVKIGFGRNAMVAAFR